MLSELNIEKYRGIDSLKLEDLGRVNVIAGENNTGKTSILEVIESLERPNDLRAWRLIGRREGNSMRISTTSYDTMKSLFPINNENKKTSIVYSGEYNNKLFTVELTGEFSDTILNDEQLEKIRGYRHDYGTTEYEHNEYEVSLLDIYYKINGENFGSDKIYNVQRGFATSTDIIASIVENVVYVSPTQHANNSFYLNALMTDPKLDEMTRSRKYVVLSKKFNEGLLLNAYGDGMKKAMLLLSALLKAKDGILLLDEFETAIHVSVMGKVFKWIIENAAKLNVQIFMTSHSLEAINSVLKCCPDMQKDIRMITLVNTEDGVKARNVDALKAIQLMDEYGLELR